MLNIINFREAKKLKIEETIFKWNLKYSKRCI
jgi:hypothetical protein